MMVRVRDGGLDAIHEKLYFSVVSSFGPLGIMLVKFVLLDFDHFIM